MLDASPNPLPDDTKRQAEHQAKESLLQGQRAFEAGQYTDAIQQFEQGKSLASSGTALQGELQIWLVTAYEASGDLPRALELCRRISHHPDMETRKQAKRLLYILEAPKLRMNPEWLTEIPDLTDIKSKNEDRDWGRPILNLLPPEAPKAKPPEGYVIPEPTDPTKVNMGDERSLLWALASAMFVLASVILWAIA